MKRTKSFDCVEMKHKAGEKIERSLQGKSLSQRLEFWKEQTEKLKKRKKKVSESASVSEPKTEYLPARQTGKTKKK